jgi:fibro-slime domain-containing protein
MKPHCRSGCLAVFTCLAVAGCNISPTIHTDKPPAGGESGGAAGAAAAGAGGGNGLAPAPLPQPGGAGPDAGLVLSPSDFYKTEVGGYKLGPPITGDMTPSGPAATPQGCNTIVGVVRDFKGFVEYMGHPDFEAYQGDMPTVGLVAPDLGPDSRPVYASRCEAGVMRGSPPCPFGRMTTSKAAFDQWYHFADGINKQYLVYFLFQTTAGLSTFSSTHFFPLDGAGWGDNQFDTSGVKHDFGFTTELHMKFKYVGGEHFTFTGDDDLWVFINKKLAIDLGGLHPPVSGTIDLDQSATALGLARGEIYPIELFHAERHSQASNFRVDTNLVLVDCGKIID